MKQKWIDMYMDFAQRAADESYSKRLKVGSVFVSTEGVMSIGINGMPPGADNNCEYKRYLDNEEYVEMCSGEGICEEIGEDDAGFFVLVTRPEVSHSEQNLFAKMMREGVRSKDGYLFVTHVPCIDCAKQIIGGGIKHLYYKHEYRSTIGLSWLKKSGVEVIKV